MASDNYKEYSLGRLKEWLHDCLGAAEASPQEIYNTIKEVVQEEYYYYKDGASKTNELLQLLNGTVQFHIDPKGNKVECAIGDTSEYCKNSWTNFWEENQQPSWVEGNNLKKIKTHDEMIASGWEMTADGFWIKEDKNTRSWEEYYYPGELPGEVNDKVTKWHLPVEIDAASEEYYVSFPDDLLEAANLKEGDRVEWVDNNDGTYTLKKAN